MNHILVVDDENSIRITLKAILERQGWPVDIAGDAATALKLTAEKDYAVILTDIVMPHMSGLALVREICRQADHARARTPARANTPTRARVLIMTGEPSIDTAIEAVKLGANDYLRKPIDRDLLVETVRHAIETKETEDRAIERENERLIYQAELERLVRMRTLELEDALESIVLLLSNVIEIRDPYTAGHQRRVGNLAAAIADRLGRPATTVNQVRIIGYLHDIGKMIVPADILTKTGRLNEFEMGLIRLHPRQGFDMLGTTRLPGQIAEVIHQHHERENGTGYPRGLAHDQILDEAAILIVADVVEAMMSHRPYRVALGLDKALDEIRANRGILYRPTVVDACVALFTQEHYTLDDTAHPIQFNV